MFNTLLKASSSKTIVSGHDEIDRYLATNTEDVEDALFWWWERKSSYPCLSRMALDYLSIPGTQIAFSPIKLIIHRHIFFCSHLC
jgi:hypothetical protein